MTDKATKYLRRRLAIAWSTSPLVHELDADLRRAEAELSAERRAHIRTLGELSAAYGEIERLLVAVVPPSGPAQ